MEKSFLTFRAFLNGFIKLSKNILELKIWLGGIPSSILENRSFLPEFKEKGYSGFFSIASAPLPYLPSKSMVLLSYMI